MNAHRRVARWRSRENDESGQRDAPPARGEGRPGFVAYKKAIVALGLEAQAEWKYNMKISKTDGPPAAPCAGCEEMREQRDSARLETLNAIARAADAELRAERAESNEGASFWRMIATLVALLAVLLSRACDDLERWRRAGDCGHAIAQSPRHEARP